MVVEALYFLFTAGLAVAGLALVGAAVRAYAHTSRPEMIYLALGFTLVVSASVATAIGAYVTDFTNVRTLLLVNNGLSMAGYLFVIYSVVGQ